MSNRYRNDNGYGGAGRGRVDDDYDPYAYDDSHTSGRYGAQRSVSSRDPPPAARSQTSRSRMRETNAERQIALVLEHIRSEWPSMCDADCVPVQLALQLLDSSSVGRAHEYRKFRKTHAFLQDSLKNIVHEHHQGFNSSIGTFHKIQGSLHASQKRVRALKESLDGAKTSLCATDPTLKNLSLTSQSYDELLQTLNELDELRAVPDKLEARVSQKHFLTAVDVLHKALRKLRRPELDAIGALNDLRGYLANQETVLMDTLVEELHEHLYLKSPYCQERWQNLAKGRGAYAAGYGNTSSITPFKEILETIDVSKAVTEDPMNPEADTFSYIGLLVEALNKLGRLQNAVETLKQRLPVELFGVVNETINEVDQRHPSSLRGGTGRTKGLLLYGTRETQLRADLIDDLLRTLYGKFEAIAEGHRMFHESIKALIRREGAGNNSALLGSFKELWNLYQNEIRSLLHNYVTTDADVYQFDSPVPGGGGLNGKKDAMREHLFKFAETDAKSTETMTEYDALEGIIQGTVPGLTSNTKKTGADAKKSRVTVDGGTSSRRDGGFGPGAGRQATGSFKPLVEPSVFNMSLLLPPTLTFLDGLINIMPHGSDLAASTRTSFLDNFLVNVFQPQLDETLGKLSDSVFGEADSFLQDPSWSQSARRPVFKGTTAFFQVVTAFCRMLGTLPHDQSMSGLVVSQMVRYYDRCFTWYRSLVTKTPEQASDASKLRASARFAVQPGEMQETMRKLWTSDGVDEPLLEKEVHLLMEQTNESRLEMDDVIQERETISSLCLLYTSMKWLATKISGLRHITMVETDSSRQALPQQANERWWPLMNRRPLSEEGPATLPLTQETVQTFDKMVTSYEELAGTALLTLHMEVRCRIVYSLRNALSPDLAPYLLDQEVREPDPQILGLNHELVLFDETVARFLRGREVSFIRTGLGLLTNSYLVGNASMASPMNAKGCGRMQLNILVLQQNLKNIEEGVDLARAADYFALFDRGADAIADQARAKTADEFTYEELKTLLELYYSEPLANPERGIASAARRKMDEALLVLSEHMWQT